MSNDPRNIFVDQRMDSSATDKQEETTQKQQYDKMSVEDKKKTLTELAQKYQKEGEGQLITDILNNVIEQKASGTLDNKQLQLFASRIMPMLNSEQKQRLEGLLQQLLKL